MTIKHHDELKKDFETNSSISLWRYTNDYGSYYDRKFRTSTFKELIDCMVPLVTTYKKKFIFCEVEAIISDHKYQTGLDLPIELYLACISDGAEAGYSKREKQLQKIFFGCLYDTNNLNTTVSYIQKYIKLNP
jgi:hypothetical protein